MTSPSHGAAAYYAFLSGSSTSKWLRAYFRHYCSNSVDLQDLVQETYCQALDSLRCRGPPPSPTYGPWLAGIARHVRTQALRKHYRPRLEPPHEDPPARTLDGLAALIARDDKHEQEQRLLDLHARIAQLPPIYRQAIELFYFEHKRIKAIAQDVGFSVGAVKVRLCRARKHLRANGIHVNDFPNLYVGSQSNY